MIAFHPLQIFCAGKSLQCPERFNLHAGRDVRKSEKTLKGAGHARRLGRFRPLSDALRNSYPCRMSLFERYVAHLKRRALGLSWGH